MNETLKVIAERFSCRDFSDRVPSDKDLEAIAQAAIQAPSGMNAQTWQVIMVKDKGVIDKLNDEGMRILSQSEDKTFYDRIMSRGGKLFYNAPRMVIFATPLEKKTGYEYVDLGIIAQNVVLAATSLGLASVHCGLIAIPFSGDRGDELKSDILLPDCHEIKLAVLLGYAKEAGIPHLPDQSKITWIG